LKTAAIVSQPDVYRICLGAYKYTLLKPGGLKFVAGGRERGRVWGGTASIPARWVWDCCKLCKLPRRVRIAFWIH